MAAKTTGIRQRHGNACRTRGEGRCQCPWEASVYSAKDGRKLRKTFPTRAAAKAWRDDAAGQIRRGQLRAPTPVTLDEAATEWLAGATAGIVRTSTGDPYKAASLRAMEKSLRLRVLPHVGRVKLSAITRRDCQDLVDRLQADGWSASTIDSAVLPLRAIYARAIDREQLSVNPTVKLRMPRAADGRDRVAAPIEAASLLAALPDQDRGLWAVALYGGLRRGELMGLRWADVDLTANLLHVRRGYDDRTGEFITPKSRKGVRTIPIAKALRAHLLAHRLATVGGDDALVFGRSSGEPFAAQTIAKRAKAAWKAAGLTPITLHECRHTFASLMIGAGCNLKAVSTFCGHASVTITADRYGHLFPGAEDEAGALLDAYLDAATG
jgi:integrase